MEKEFVEDEDRERSVGGLRISGSVMAGTEAHDKLWAFAVALHKLNCGLLTFKIEGDQPVTMEEFKALCGAGDKHGG